MNLKPILTVLFVSLLMPTTTWAAGQSITVASTTSTQSSGLFDVLLPQFKQSTGIQVNVVAVGTGQAIRLAEKGDADVLFVHHRPSEEKFIAAGFGVKRYDVMANDFVLVGPRHLKLDASRDDITALMSEIAQKELPFASRGDDSGTHKKELGIWKAAGLQPNKQSGQWYRETGSGMGATLNTAIAMNALTLTDRATWINFGNRVDYTILGEGSEGLSNPYGVILVHPEKFSHVKAEAGQQLIDWLVSDAGQKAIAAYQVKGQQLFFPTAGK